MEYHLKGWCNVPQLLLKDLKTIYNIMENFYQADKRWPKAWWDQRTDQRNRRIKIKMPKKKDISDGSKDSNQAIMEPVESSTPGKIVVDHSITNDIIKIWHKKCFKSRVVYYCKRIIFFKAIGMAKMLFFLAYSVLLEAWSSCIRQEWRLCI